MNATRPEVTILMPCLNESETLGTCIHKAREAIRMHHLEAEIVVADNGSQDGSPRIARALGARVVEVQAKGYGAALMAGIENAKGTFIIMGDADDSYDFGAIFPFIENLRKGYDLVMGTRDPRRGGVILPGAMPWTHRWFGNPVLSALGRLFFRSAVSDFHCGLRAFRRDAISGLDLRTTGMEFASELVIKATSRDLRITEVPVTLHRDGRSRPSHLRTWHDGWRHLRFMLLYSPGWLFMLPGCVLFLFGVLVGFRLLHGPLTVSGVGFDTNTLLVAAAAVLVGFKLLAFSVFARVFASVEGLFPEDYLVGKIVSFFKLEIGIVIGLLTTLAGFALLGWGLLYWRQHQFGALSYPDSLRIVIPGVTACILGIEMIFSSFFLSILQLNRR